MLTRNHQVQRRTLVPRNGRNAMPMSEAQHFAEFLKSEVAAMDVYRIAIQQIESQEHPNADELALLRQIRTDHAEQAQLLRQLLRADGQSIEDGNNAWSLWDRAMMSTASQYGGPAILRALKESEEQWLADYRRGVDDLGGRQRQLLWTQFIPVTQQHVDLLEDLLADRSPAV